MHYRIFDIEHSVIPLFISVPATKLIEILESAVELLHFRPEILEKINDDQDKLAKEKKKLRLEDKRYYQNKNAGLAGIDTQENEIAAHALELETGRTRMFPQVLFVFTMVRGYFGSVTSKESVQRMHDSYTLHTVLQGWNINMPGATTILENLNCISNETREYILDAQMELVLREGLDDFSTILIDSTHVKANTEWPTDSKMIFALLSRAYHYSQKLSIFGLQNFRPFWMPNWLGKLDRLIFAICMTAGKAKSKGKIKKLYRRFLQTAQKAHDYLISEIEGLTNQIELIDLCPSQMEKLNRIWKLIGNDVMDSARVLYYAEDRVFNEIVLKSSEKILSISDRSAAFIKKGNRSPVIGYKPQVARSGSGFIPAIIVPEGNAADSDNLIPMAEKVIGTTTVVPHTISTDDGYASKNNRVDLLTLGVEVVSINGSKGKKLTPEDEWNSEEYRRARADRSAVESIMFTLKYVFDFGYVRRRGIDEVKAELLEKVIVYNLMRIIALRSISDTEDRKKAS